MLKLNKSLILASGSPRRKEILEKAGFAFELRLKDIDESFDESTPTENVSMMLAGRKADAFEVGEGEVLLTADTIVVVGHEILNKPADAAEAKEMLQRLSGLTHQVITGFCIKTSEKAILQKDVAYVTFKELTDAEIDYYIQTCRPFDKAGAYGVQEFISLIGNTAIDGSFYTVMGLPIHRVYQTLTDLNIIIWD